MRETVMEKEVFMREFGQDIKRARREQGLTQDELATQMQLAGCDVDRKRVGRLEHAERVLTAEELLVLASILFLDLNRYSHNFVGRMQTA